MFLIILQLLESALAIWQYKEKNKYIDRMIDLKTRYYAEQNKPLAERDFAVVDTLEMEIKILSTTVASDMKREAA